MVLGRDDQGPVIRFKVDVIVHYISKSEPIYEECCFFISKSKDPFVPFSWQIKVESDCGYNVKTRRWKERDYLANYFNGVSTKALNDLICEKWEEINGPIPAHAPKKLDPVTINFSTKNIELLYEKDILHKLPEQTIMPGTSGTDYKVNLQQLQCSCPDFTKKRKKFPENDVRRVCKHQAQCIVRKLKKNKALTENEMIQHLVRKASSTEKGVKVYRNLIETKIKDNTKGPKQFYIMTPAGDKQWAEVILPAGAGSYQWFGYNISEQRWARADNPFPSGSKRQYNLAVQKAIKGT